MRKYILIGFLILIFSLAGLAQSSSEPIQIIDFVWVTTSTDKTAIFVGDRVELRLEIVYPRDWGVEILTEDLDTSGIQSFLPESLVIERAEISLPFAWQEYWLKIEAVYILFYPEKKDNTGISFEPIRVRFKWLGKDTEPQKEVKIYEVETKQFVLGVRSTLTPTSNEPRDSKTFSGNFTLKFWLGLVVGLIIILYGLSIPVRALVRLVKKQKAEKKVASRVLLKAEYRKLTAISVLNPDQFCSILRKIIEIKAGIKAAAMTSVEIKERTLNQELTRLAEILEKHDNARYNPDFKLDIETSKNELIELRTMLEEWTTSKFWKQLNKLFKRRKRDG